MRIKDLVKPSEQTLLICRAQCKDCSSNNTGLTSRKLATRLKGHRSAIRNYNIKASLMAAHCADTGHDFYLAEAEILCQASDRTARFLKKRVSAMKIQTTSV